MDRYVFADGDVDGVHDVPAAPGAERAAHGGRVGAVGDHRAAGDQAPDGGDAAVVGFVQEPDGAEVEEVCQPYGRVARILGEAVGEYGRGGEHGHRGILH
jgi:hypothetical protein